MTYTPGTHAASILLDRGLPFAAAVRGLIAEVGFSADQATLAVTAAAADRRRRPAPDA